VYVSRPVNQEDCVSGARLRASSRRYVSDRLTTSTSSPAATQRENVAKLRRAGADTVISPASIGGHLLVESAPGGRDVDTEAVADRLLKEI